MGKTAAFTESWLAKRIVKSDHGCWLWQGALMPNGYGRMSFRMHNDYSHRHFFRFFIGEIGNMHVLHRCDVRRCVNPDHLFLGTHIDNMRDMNSKGRRVACGFPGEHNPRAKLTDDQVDELRALFDSGASIRSLMARFGIGRTQTRYLAKRITRGERQGRFKRVFEEYATVIVLR
jgi:hypothetical protein